MSALERAIEAAGGLSKLAVRLKVSPQVIFNWRKRGIPGHRVLDVEAATVTEEGSLPKVTRHELRPDLYPEERAA